MFATTQWTNRIIEIDTNASNWNKMHSKFNIPIKSRRKAQNHTSKMRIDKKIYNNNNSNHNNHIELAKLYNLKKSGKMQCFVTANTLSICRERAGRDTTNVCCVFFVVRRLKICIKRLSTFLSIMVFANLMHFFYSSVLAVFRHGICLFLFLVLFCFLRNWTVPMFATAIIIIIIIFAHRFWIVIAVRLHSFSLSLLYLTKSFFWSLFRSALVNVCLCVWVYTQSKQK